MKLKPINQQVVVVVGATSGIGRITALRFAERGAKVVLAGRSHSALQSLVDEIYAKGGEATSIVADVSEYDQVKSIADHATSTYGRIDTWVQAAAASMYATFEHTTPQEFKRVIDVNLMSQVYGAMAALPVLKQVGRGALIHITSVEARRALPYQSAYAASKRGIVAFLDALRMELDEEGLPISVTNVMPASINTPLFSKALTRLGVKPRPLAPVYEPEVVADVILHAAEHPVREIYAGGTGKGFGLLQRFSPNLAERTVKQIAFEGQKTNLPKAENSPHNLFSHIEGFDKVKGEFSDEALPTSPYTRVQTSSVAKWGVAALALVAGAFVSRRIIRYRQKARSTLVERVVDRVRGFFVKNRAFELPF